MATHRGSLCQGAAATCRYIIVLRRLLVLAALLAPLSLPHVAGAGDRGVARVLVAAADVTVTLDGHGNGHGYGLSQWGAYGYAVDKGWTSAQILDHYYGGTVAGAVPTDTAVVVRLQNLDDAQTAVVSASGGLVVDGVAGGPWKSVVAREVSPSVYSVWARADAQLCPSAGDPLLNPWTLVAGAVATQVNIRTQVSSVVATDFGDLPAVCEPGGTIRSYRGFIRAVNGSVGENRTVNEVPIEHYLRSVIAKEMSPSWAAAGGGAGAQALQAQAVAARSYALAENRYTYARTCDMICQFYAGAATRSSVASAYTRTEYPATDAAVLAVAGVVRRVGNTSGPIAYTMFAASSGGWTAAGVGQFMPFPAVADLGDSTPLNPNFSWSATLAGSAISNRYPSIGSFAGLTVLARNGLGDWGGRVTSMRVTGSAGSVTITGDQFRSAFGLKSNWFNVRGAVSVDPCDGRSPSAIGPAPATAPAARYSPLAPTRLVDTRNGTGTKVARLAAGCTLVINPGLDPTVTAVAVNITAVDTVGDGYVTAYPCGVERPNVSAVQALNGRTVAGMAVVPLGANGTFCVFSSVSTELIADLFGSYAKDIGSKFEPVAPVRMYDSRSATNRLAAGTILRVPIVRSGGAPAGATAAALTLHAVSATGTGYASVFPCSSSVPVVSNINVVNGSSVTNHVEVALNTAGEVCVYLSVAMHVAVDFSGWFGAGGSSEFYAVAPYRALDTRNGIGLTGAFAANVDRALTMAGTKGLPAAGSLRAIVAEVTAVSPTAVGYVTVHPCLVPVPSVSMVRYAVGANAATSVVGTDDTAGRWCISASTQVHVLVDVSGYFA